jgi:hypothetical protein
MKRKWLWIIGAVVAAAALLALGVSLQTLLILAALLACPAAVYFGMRRHGRQDGASRPVRADKRRRIGPQAGIGLAADCGSPILLQRIV